MSQMKKQLSEKEKQILVNTLYSNFHLSGTEVREKFEKNRENTRTMHKIIAK